jgi:hypothetical protein
MRPMPSYVRPSSGSIGPSCFGRPYAAISTGLHPKVTPLAGQLEPLDDGERALMEVADWGPAEDWSDWADAAR